MKEKETKQFTKRIYTANNNPTSLLHRTLVPKKSPSEKDAPYWKKLCEILQDLQKLSSSDDHNKTKAWIEQSITELETLIDGAGIEKRGHAMQNLINRVKGK